MIDRFREEVYQSFRQRADAGMDLIDALTGSVAIESPVASSASPLFRRKFSSIYDLLNYGKLNVGQLGQVLNQRQPEDAELVAGYEVYGLDCTDGHPAPEAETLADRSQAKRGGSHPRWWAIATPGWCA